MIRHGGEKEKKKTFLHYPKIHTFSPTPAAVQPATPPLLLSSDTHHAHFNPPELRLHEDTQTTSVVSFLQKLTSVLPGTHHPDSNLVKKTLAEADIFRGDAIFLDGGV